MSVQSLMENVAADGSWILLVEYERLASYEMAGSNADCVSGRDDAAQGSCVDGDQMGDDEWVVDDGEVELDGLVVVDE